MHWKAFKQYRSLPDLSRVKPLLLRYCWELLGSIAYEREIQVHWKVFKHLLGIRSIKFIFRTIVWKQCNCKYSCIAKFSNTCLEYGASYSYSKQLFENLSMQLYFPFIGNLSKSQQYLSTTETSKHFLIQVLYIRILNKCLKTFQCNCIFRS